MLISVRTIVFLSFLVLWFGEKRAQAVPAQAYYRPHEHQRNHHQPQYRKTYVPGVKRAPTKMKQPRPQVTKPQRFQGPPPGEIGEQSSILWNSQTHFSAIPNCQYATQEAFCNTIKTKLEKDPFTPSFEKLLECYSPMTKGVFCTDHKERTNQFLVSFSESKIGRELKVMLGVHRNQEFVAILHRYWFGNQLQDGIDGFRHVFVGDRRKGRSSTYSGFHNWYQYFVEKCNKGTITEVSVDNRYGEANKNEIICNLQFLWHGEHKHKKSTSTILFGSAPEFDFAVSTYCFYRLGGKSGTCRVKMGRTSSSLVVVGNRSSRDAIKTAYFSK